MVFLPPNPLDSSSWLFQVAHFSSWFRTLSVDLPGYGHSARAAGPLTMPDLADAVWDAVTAQGVGRAVLAGVSIGAAPWRWDELALDFLKRRTASFAEG